MEKRKRMKSQEVTPEHLAFANWFHKYQEKNGHVMFIEDFPYPVSLEAFLSVHPMKIGEERRREIEDEYERFFGQIKKRYHETITFSNLYNFFYERLSPGESNIPREITRH